MTTASIPPSTQPAETLVRLGSGTLSVPKLLGWLLGFWLCCNIYALPMLAQTPRATDLIGLGLYGWLIVHAMRGKLRLSPFLLLLALGLLPLPWLIYFVLGNPDATTVVFCLRWLLALPYAYALYLVSHNREQRLALVWGMWWGVVANVGVLAAQFAGFDALTRSVGLAPLEAATNADLYGRTRSIGMQGHPNGSAGTASLLIPLALFLYYWTKTRVWIVPTSFLIFAVAIYTTSTRSALLVSLVSLLVVSLILILLNQIRRPLRLMEILLIAGLLATPVIGTLELLEVSQKWTDLDNYQRNASERLLSNYGAIALSFDHPTGLGFSRGYAALERRVGLTASHNAFLQAGIVFGPFVGALLLIGLALCAATLIVRPGPARGLSALIALQLIGIFFFEDHLNNPTMLVLILWVFTNHWASAVTIRTSSNPTHTNLSNSNLSNSNLSNTSLTKATR